MSILITKNFLSTHEEFISLIDKDTNFKKQIAKKMEDDKRIKPNKLDSARIRFAEAFYVKARRRDKISKLKESVIDEKT